LTCLLYCACYILSIKASKSLEVELAGGGMTGCCITKGNILALSFVPKNVYYSHFFQHNLLSISELNKVGYNWYFTKDRCYTYEKEDFIDDLATRGGESGLICIMSVSHAWTWPPNFSYYIHQEIHLRDQIKPNELMPMLWLHKKRNSSEILYTNSELINGF
jgi:hypothetical protein